MKKYITLFLGYSIVFHVLMYLCMIILGTLAGFVFIFIGGIAAAIGVSLIDFSNFSFSDLSILSIVFNLVLIVLSYGVFFTILKMVTDRAFKGNIKQGFFTKETIKADLIYSIVFFSLVPIIFGIMDLIKGIYGTLIFVIIYIISFVIINNLKQRKEFISNK